LSRSQATLPLRLPKVKPAAVTAQASVEFTVPGKAVPKARPRFSSGGVTYTDPATKGYENLVGTLAKIAMRGANPLSGPLEAVLTVMLAPPCGLSKASLAAALSSHSPTGPDVDNLAKSLLDGMNRVVYHDDRQVAKLTVAKIYGREPHVKIRVQQIRPE
jgi:Holliday junction resolvase RusA-like endonuclease